MAFNNFRSYLGALVVLMASVLMVGCDNPSSNIENKKQLPIVTVGYIPIADAAQLYVAQDLGLFEKHGIKVNSMPFAGGAKIIQALAVGELDIGFTGTVPLVQANSRGIEIKAITGGSIQSSNNPYQALVTTIDSGIQEPKQLAGTTIGVNAFRSIDHSFTLAWLAKNNIDKKTVRFVEIPFPQMEAALASGQIQVASLIDPFLTFARERGNIKVIDHHIVAINPNFEMTTYVVAPSKVEQNKAKYKSFQKAIVEATELINGGKADLPKAISNHTKLDEQTIKKTTVPQFGSALTTKNLTFVVDMMLNLGFIDKAPNVEALIQSLD